MRHRIHVTAEKINRLAAAGGCEPIRTPETDARIRFTKAYGNASNALNSRWTSEIAGALKEFREAIEDIGTPNLPERECIDEVRKLAEHWGTRYRECADACGDFCAPDKGTRAA